MGVATLLPTAREAGEVADVMVALRLDGRTRAAEVLRVGVAGWGEENAEGCGGRGVLGSGFR